MTRVASEDYAKFVLALLTTEVAPDALRRACAASLAQCKAPEVPLDAILRALKQDLQARSARDRVACAQRLGLLLRRDLAAVPCPLMRKAHSDSNCKCPDC